MEQARINRTSEITLMLLAGVGIAYLAEEDTLGFFDLLLGILFVAELAYLFIRQFSYDKN